MLRATPIGRGALRLLRAAVASCSSIAGGSSPRRGARSFMHALPSRLVPGPFSTFWLGRADRSMLLLLLSLLLHAFHASPVSVQAASSVS